jgi:hypothetical protein
VMMIHLDNLFARLGDTGGGATPPTKTQPPPDHFNWTKCNFASMIHLRFLRAPVIATKTEQFSLIDKECGDEEITVFSCVFHHDLINN